MSSVSLQRTSAKGVPTPMPPGGYPNSGYNNPPPPGYVAYPQAGGAPQPYGQQMPGQPMPGQPMPGQPMPGQQMPMGQQMPGQQMPGQMPMGQQMPGQMPMGQQMPGQMPMGQQMPGQMPMGQQMPGQMPMGQQMPGQMPMGQVGMNPPLGSMPGQMGQMPMGGMPGQMPGRISLVKGQNMSLSKQCPNLRRAVIGLGWDVRQSAGAGFDLDTSCFMLNAQNMCIPQNFIFYNNRQSMDGSVMHRGDNLTGQGEGDDEQIVVDLTRIPMDIQRIVFVVSIYEAVQRGQNFGMVQRAFIRIVDQETNMEIVRYDLTEEACMQACMLFGELYRYGNEWKFKALGQPVMNGLVGAGQQFGMQLA